MSHRSRSSKVRNEQVGAVAQAEDHEDEHEGGDDPDDSADRPAPGPADGAQRDPQCEGQSEVSLDPSASCRSGRGDVDSDRGGESDAG